MKNQVAFPTQTYDYDDQGKVLQYQEAGMTLRDHFAGLAMQAGLARGDDTNRPGIAEWAYRMADEMLNERLMK